MTPEAVIKKMESAGFSLRLDQGDLIVTPAGKLDAMQRQYLQSHKTALVDFLTAANDAPVYVECWTPFGGRMVIMADTPEHAERIRQDNPKPPPGGWPGQ